MCIFSFFLFFFFNDTATTEIYTLSLHDALPIFSALKFAAVSAGIVHTCALAADSTAYCWGRNSFGRSEEHTSELQSQSNLVCRLLLEKKKNKQNTHSHHPHELSNDVNILRVVCS